MGTNLVEEITEADVLARLRELIAHGFGRLEVVVRDEGISILNWEKSTKQDGSRKNKTQPRR